MRSVRALVVCGLLLLAPTGCSTGRGGEPGAAITATSVAANATVERIVDGDTIDVTVGDTVERIRLIGIDTPEIAHDAFGDRPATAGECFGTEAAAFTAELVPVGTPVRLVRDIVGRDDYGRLLAYVYRAGDGLFVNVEIVRRGYARPLTIAPNEAHRELVVGAARDAAADELGLWSACS